MAAFDERAAQQCCAVRADFQKGGFDFEDAKCVAAQLNTLGLDLLELSGGNYESPAMQGQTRDGSTLAREAYFLEFAERIAIPWHVSQGGPQAGSA